MGAHGWGAGICQPWGQFFYLGAGWPQWKPLGILGTHLPLKRGSWLTEIYSERCENGVSPRGVLWISSDRDDQRILGGLKFSISGFFGVGKFWQVFFLGKFDLSRDFFGYSKLMFLFFVLYHLMLSGNF